MKYEGTTYRFEPTYRVLDAVVTDGRLSIDWDEHGSRGHLEATSDDGDSFVGTFGYTRLEAENRVEFAKFRGRNGALVLMGHWLSKDGTEGDWIIRLRPIES